MEHGEYTTRNSVTCAFVLELSDRKIGMVWYVWHVDLYGHRTVTGKIRYQDIRLDFEKHTVKELATGSQPDPIAYSV